MAIYSPYRLQISFHIPVEEAKKILKDNGEIGFLQDSHSPTVEVVVTASYSQLPFRVDIITGHSNNLGLFDTKTSVMLKADNPAIEGLVQKAKGTLEKFYPCFWEQPRG